VPAPISAIAVSLFKSASPPVPQQRPQAGPAALVAAAHGVRLPDLTGHSSIGGAAVESVFDSGFDVQKLKVDLMRRAGEELGVRMEDFESPRNYAAALRAALGHLKASPGGATAITALEKKLGLDKLGVSLDDLISAIDNPDGKASGKLDTALGAKAGENAQAPMRAVVTDEDGLYRF